MLLMSCARVSAIISRVVYTSFNLCLHLVHKHAAHQLPPKWHHILCWLLYACMVFWAGRIHACEDMTDANACVRVGVCGWALL